MLLEAYGFGTIGQIALIAATVSYAAAGLMLILSNLGFIHLRRTVPEREILPAIATASRSTPADAAPRYGLTPGQEPPAALNVAGGPSFVPSTNQDHRPADW